MPNLSIRTHKKTPEPRGSGVLEPFLEPPPLTLGVGPWKDYLHEVRAAPISKIIFAKLVILVLDESFHVGVSN